MCHCYGSKLWVWCTWISFVKIFFTVHTPLLQRTQPHRDSRITLLDGTRVSQREGVLREGRCVLLRHHSRRDVGTDPSRPWFHAKNKGGGMETCCCLHSQPKCGHDVTCTPPPKYGMIAPGYCMFDSPWILYVCFAEMILVLMICAHCMVLHVLPGLCWIQASGRGNKIVLHANYNFYYHRSILNTHTHTHTRYL